jgi:hypothetical protein
VKIDSAFDQDAPADNRHDHRNPVPHIVGRDDERSQREVQESVVNLDQPELLMMLALTFSRDTLQREQVYCTWQLTNFVPERNGSVSPLESPRSSGGRAHHKPSNPFEEFS